jgi:hypothetical protein
MDHAITIGMVVYTIGGVLGAIGVIAILVWILSVFASGFNH